MQRDGPSGFTQISNIKIDVIFNACPIIICECNRIS